ncbi:NAD(P)-dependent oxidoreductase [Marinobacterium litorale]|uniref:NAD(P)-dependent oxidoreductase n=1 Tax=Marinobacterium litorale TaxID=404770 RepID=UPI0004052F4D|nr:NAD(P)-dependent oxidoreductase [Marinobacterium litorale]
MHTPKLGFIGMGLMGIPMSRRLMQAGYSVCVWNRTPDKCEPLRQQGAQVASSIAELLASCDILFTCVSDSAAMEELVLGSEGIATHGQNGQILIDCSSIAPDTTRSLADDIARRCGMHWVDAPVSGGVAGAEQGTLAIMAGGDEKIVDHVRPVLAPLSQRVTYMGPVGSGQVTKICNQMLVSCNVLVMAEVFALGEKAGIDTERLPEALSGGFADSIPLQLTGPRMANKAFDEIKWHVKTLLKDLDMAGDLARAMGSATPMAGLGAELMRQHGCRGYLEQDPATLIKLFQDN